MTQYNNISLIYMPFLKNFFYVSGSVGRNRYKNNIINMLNEVSDTLPLLFEKENMRYTPHDLDLIYIDDNGNENILNILKFLEIMIFKNNIPIKNLI